MCVCPCACLEKTFFPLCAFSIVWYRGIFFYILHVVSQAGGASHLYQKSFIKAHKLYFTAGLLPPGSV